MKPDTQEDNRAAFEAMFEHASIGIVISNQEGKIERVNPAADCLFGYAPGELVGQKIEVLIPPALKKTHIRHRAHYNEHPTARPMGLGMDLSALKKDGSIVPIEISLATYETGDRKEIVSFISDITKRKKDEEVLRTLTVELDSKVNQRTEELSQAIRELQQTNENLQREMEQRKKAEEEVLKALEKEKDLSELKSRFVSMASHEFRTPLSGILTSVSLIDRHQQAGDPGKAKKHIETIKSSVRNLTTLLNDFLSLDKLEAGKIECRPRSFSIEEFARDLTEEMQSLAKKGQTIVHRHSEDADHGTVFLDQELLRNILLNLLSNAVKYSHEGGEIHFETKVEGSKVILSVRDKGIGIPESERGHLFERFFRARNATAIQGTGLGLNIVKRYLDLMKGTIEYTSGENKGATFTVTLPLTPALSPKGRGG